MENETEDVQDVDEEYIKSAPYYPKANWVEEIIHKTEQQFLEKRKNILKDNFVLELELDNLILFYNNKKHTETGYSLNELKDIDEPLLREEVQNKAVLDYYLQIFT